MIHHNNFKAVVYCVAPWVATVTRDQLENEYTFLEKYIGIDKVYIETYRECLASKEQITMIQQFFLEKGIEVAGGITTITANLNESDHNRQRLFGTFCFSNEAMRELLKGIVEYTASKFDEFIIDDYFFTQCTCEDCRREKGQRSWQEYRLEKMLEVSKNVVIKPAKRMNPNVQITIKYPNWAESYQETGYNPKEQKDVFEKIYTGTETRDATYQDQHLPRYLSYSILRYMENVAPLRNGGGWFDPFCCYSMDIYLEQMYLTVFARAKEIMHFNWSSLYDNKLTTPLGYELNKLDKLLDYVGRPTGLAVYLPYNAQGEDHVEDYLGMLGIPLEPMPDFDETRPSVLLTAAALKDDHIVEKLKQYVAFGNQAIVTSGFMIGALQGGLGIEEMTSIRYRGRNLIANRFLVSGFSYDLPTVEVSDCNIHWPLLEHRNNASWSIINAGVENFHASIALLDTYGKGKLYTINIPDMYSHLNHYPKSALKLLRKLCIGEGKVYMDALSNISLFTYDNQTFCIYAYYNALPQKIQIHVIGKTTSLITLPENRSPRIFDVDLPAIIKPDYETEDETIFSIQIEPCRYIFFQIR